MQKAHVCKNPKCESFDMQTAVLSFRVLDVVYIFSKKQTNGWLAFYIHACLVLLRTRVRSFDHEDPQPSPKQENELLCAFGRAQALRNHV